MRRVVFDKHGDPASVLRCQEEPDPEPGPGQAVVALEAAAVHPADLLTIAGRYAARPRLPNATPGMEGVGRVVAVAPDVSLAVGTRVLLPLGSGTWRDRIAVSTARLLPVSDALDPRQLALAVVNPATASLLLTELVAVRPGEWIVHNAANSAVGLLIAAEARARGIQTVNLVRREAAGLAVRNAGGDVVIVGDDRVRDDVRAYTDGAQIRLALDAVAGHATEVLASCLGHGGTVVSYGAMSGEPCGMSAAHPIFHDVRLQGFWLTAWWRGVTDPVRHALVGRHLDQLAQGLRRIPIAGTYPLDRVSDAVTHAQDDGRNGKIVLSGEMFELV